MTFSPTNCDKAIGPYIGFVHFGSISIRTALGQTLDASLMSGTFVWSFLLLSRTQGLT
jgi:hypothetical protein